MTRRHHLTREQRRDLMQTAEVGNALSTSVDTPSLPSEAVARELAPLRAEPVELRDRPERSNLSVANTLSVSDKTVAAVREDLVSRSELPNVAQREDTLGREQPASKPPRPVAEPEPEATVTATASVPETPANPGVRASRAPAPDSARAAVVVSVRQRKNAPAAQERPGARHEE